MFRFGSEGAKRKAGGKPRESTKTKAVQEKRNERLVGYAREAKRWERSVFSERRRSRGCGGGVEVEVCGGMFLSLSVSLDGEFLTT